MNQDIAKQANEVVQRAASSSGDIDTSKPGQISTAVSTLVASGSLAYFLGSDSAYFSNSVSPSEFPVYAAFIALASLSAKNLVSICGRKTSATVIAGALTGGSTGLGTGLTIAGMALGLVGDIVLCGGLTLTGLIMGYLLTRRGKKRHSCGAKLPCDTWICTRCKRIISPSRHWRDKSRWNILDVCDYLDTGGLEWNTLKALAFLNATGLLMKPTVIAGSPDLWHREEIEKATRDDKVLDGFARQWERFRKQEPAVDTQVKDPGKLKNILDNWERFESGHVTDKPILDSRGKPFLRGGYSPADEGT